MTGDVTAMCARKENTCLKRFDWQLGDLPQGYDHKYTYSHLGYNLKISDMQAAVGVAQLARLDCFIESRRRNYRQLADALSHYEDRLLLPAATPRSDPSWFGFPVTVRASAGLRESLFVTFRIAGSAVAFFSAATL